MKTFAFALIAAASADDKKVPPRHPLNRLSKLKDFAVEWCSDNLTVNQAKNWIPKFKRNTVRFEQRFELCGFYDSDQLPHGGPEPGRKRRSEDDIDCDESGICRYDKSNPIRGLQQITTGYRKWAQRYISTCKVQPGRQVDRANRWFNKLATMWVANNELNQ